MVVYAPAQTSLRRQQFSRILKGGDWAVSGVFAQCCCDYVMLLWLGSAHHNLGENENNNGKGLFLGFDKVWSEASRSCEMHHETYAVG